MRPSILLKPLKRRHAISISCRQFLIGAPATTAGIILPSFADKVLSQLEDTGIPLLEVPKTQNQLFYALYMDEYYLITDAAAGPDFDLPPPTSWRKYFEFNQTEITDKLIEEYDLSASDLGGEADAYMVGEQWEYLRSPYAQAYVKLHELETQLGPKITGDGGDLRHITFNDFTNPGSSARLAEVPCAVGLSCLQHRLNAINSGIKIEMAPDNMY